MGKWNKNKEKTSKERREESKALKRERKEQQKRIARLVPLIDIIATSTFGSEICMEFRSTQIAKEKFNSAGLTVSATIRDCSGTKHSNINTFCGFRVVEPTKANGYFDDDE